jgi:hypothetical protein
MPSFGQTEKGSAVDEVMRMGDERGLLTENYTDPNLLEINVQHMRK